MSDQRSFAFSAWAIRNPIPVAVLFIGLLLGGLIAYQSLAVKMYPNIQFPIIAVTVTQAGAAPGEMETQITRPVEDAVASVTGVRNIQSVVTQGVSTTTIEFEIGENLQKKTDEMRSKVAQIRAQLPRDIDEPQVNQIEVDDAAPIMTIAVEAPAMSDDGLSWFVDDTVARTLQSAEGVAQVSRVGGVAREINVVIDPDRMAARGLTASQVNTALRAFQFDAPGGRFAVGGREQTIRILGSVETVAQLRDMTIPTGGGQFVRLSDVADVGDGASDVRGFARLNGRPVVGFQVSKTKEASDVDAEDAVHAKLAELEKANPGVKFSTIFSSVTETRASFRATQNVLAEGMFLAALVVFFFLRDWRATAITALAMPISLIPTFLVMGLANFSLNIVTLLALTLVIGILVDDAIVEIENIEKRVARGQRPFQAALEGADAIGLAVVATTFSIVVVFTPVSFMPGISGQFFKEFGMTVSVAVLFSLVVARLVTPLMAAYFLKANPTPHERKPFKGFYRNVLEWALAHRIVAALIGGILFIGSLALVPLLPAGFQPAGDPDYLYVDIQGPPGATAPDMEATAQQITELFRKQPEVTNVFVQIGSTVSSFGPGSGGGGGGDLRRGTATILLRENRPTTGNDIKNRLREELRKIPDVRLGFLDFEGGAGFQQILTGTNPDNLEAAALELERQMRTLPQVADPKQATPPVGPEIVIRPRPDEAARLGVSSDAMANIVRIATVGDIDANVAKFNEGERRIPIRVRLPEDARTDLERLKSLRVPTASGGSTTLDSVADIEFQAGPARIDRLNRERRITVQAELNGGYQLGQAQAAVDRLPIMKNPPEGVRPSAIGTAEAMAELFGGFGVAIFSGVAMIYGVLVLLFRSFFKPIVILSALPTAVGGAFLGLLIFDLSLSIPSLIGFLMLLGLAAKNSILLVEYAIEREREGMSQHDALIDACRERARPIVMTTFAMGAGMLPTALALEKGAEFRQPMAVAVIGGLITSTILSLVLVPVVYRFVDDFENWLKPKLARMVTPREAPRTPVPEDRL
ncbi:efflux RND transporter permease subunit [Phenylobacterium sp. SCN 70-31]|uniref:efflux RND transporter permease subunit n=1 Tax=Phenylobacterium sp. SCN 70-31 TaxID=1660129 RepID=UPI00086BF5D8|nr:efflux RND transporter permease subunit [Phenylobacterium sp. SCN 70-31]ODT86501.1 MAG: multidrug transporter AcrB [Phenylobacterium sp. SCN 70-31]